ncbi:uncharacterized protein LOC117784329 [Drosophila innubila]|uniref:uncharacterized protein LOC117784329 n=1 Tax=Drosophila innubila TaxID=198719 RepID=UPI00148B92B9|nr:uncharacterized protein LOC117784329 [Drosophila innubila]
MEIHLDGKKWTTENTELLLALYGERISKFRDPKIKNKKIWREILKGMEGKGVRGLDVLQLDRKIRNLRVTFDNIKKKINFTGESGTKWRHFEDMEAIFGRDSNSNNSSHSNRTATVPVRRTLATLLTEDDNVTTQIFPDFEAATFDESAAPFTSSMLISEDLSSSSKAVSDDEQSIGFVRLKRKSDEQSNVYYQKRKKTKEAHCACTEEFRKMRVALEESNAIQLARNTMFEKLIDKLKTKL